MGFSLFSLFTTAQTDKIHQRFPRNTSLALLYCPWFQQTHFYSYSRFCHCIGRFNIISVYVVIKTAERPQMAGSGRKQYHCLSDTVIQLSGRDSCICMELGGKMQSNARLAFEGDECVAIYILGEASFRNCNPLTHALTIYTLQGVVTTYGGSFRITAPAKGKDSLSLVMEDQFAIVGNDSAYVIVRPGDEARCTRCSSIRIFQNS